MLCEIALRAQIELLEIICTSAEVVQMVFHGKRWPYSSDSATRNYRAQVSARQLG